MATYKVWLKSSEFYEIEASDETEALTKACVGSGLTKLEKFSTPRFTRRTRSLSHERKQD